MWSRIGKSIVSVGFGNALLSMILALSAANLVGNMQILQSVRKQEPTPMSSTHTVTVSSVSFTFTITTPWRDSDNGDAGVLAQRHWDQVADATAKIEELMGG